MTIVITSCSIGISFAQSDPIVRAQTISDAYGFRIGSGFRDGSSTALPVFNPYYEIPIGNIFFSAEVQLSFINFSTLNIFPLSAPSLQLDAYGWAGKVRWFYKSNSSDKFYSSAGFGMTVHPDNASTEFPLSFGYLQNLSEATELEASLNFTPLLYLGTRRQAGGWIGERYGWFISATVGLRFINF